MNINEDVSKRRIAGITLNTTFKLNSSDNIPNNAGNIIPPTPAQQIIIPKAVPNIDLFSFSIHTKISEKLPEKMKDDKLMIKIEI
jgi:hypothetical protein